MRLRHKPWARAALSKRPELVIQNPREIKGEWRKAFSANQPLHVEVGTGKGQFLAGMAHKYPDFNFIGVERYESVILSAMENIEQTAVGNAKLLCEDVSELSEFFEPGEIDRLYINFTDPWPKNRHAKRRLTHEWFLTIYKQLLKKNGEIHFKTDNQGLFEYSIHSMSTFGMALKHVSLDLHNSERVKENVMTEYEEKFSSKGMRIYRLEATFH